MRAQDYWQLFLETGAPEVYLLYSKMLRSEAVYVYDDSGSCSAGNGL